MEFLNSEPYYASQKIVNQSSDFPVRRTVSYRHKKSTAEGHCYGHYMLRRPLAVVWEMRSWIPKLAGSMDCSSLPCHMQMLGTLLCALCPKWKFTLKGKCHGSVGRDVLRHTLLLMVSLCCRERCPALNCLWLALFCRKDITF